MKSVGQIMKEYKEESGVNHIVLYNYSYSKGKLIIYSDRVGYFIGLHGMLFKKYTVIFKNNIPNFVEIEFKETNGCV